MATSTSTVRYRRDEEEPDWREDALCAETDPEAFFPEIGDSTKDAKRVCARCEVRPECLNYALEEDLRDGVWGGLSGKERRAIRYGHQPNPLPLVPLQRSEVRACA